MKRIIIFLAAIFNRPIAAFKRPTTMGAYIIKVKAIVKAIGDDTTDFPTPDPVLSVVTGHITDLETAESTANTGIEGGASARDEKYTIVDADMLNLVLYVQKQANLAPNKGAAQTIILHAGLTYKQPGTFSKPPIAGKPGKVAGTVQLTAKAAPNKKKAAYNWQQSTDNLAWVNLPATPVSKTATGVLAKGNYYFRYCYVSGGVQTLWSDAVQVYVQG